MLMKNVIAFVVFFSAVSLVVGCSDSGPSSYSTDGAGGRASADGPGTDGGPRADGPGTDGGPAACSAGCWDGRRCVLPADQTLEIQGEPGTDCRPTPLNCTGQQSAPCPTNTAPAVTLAWRGRVAYCCAANQCTLDACTKAP